MRRKNELPFCLYQIEPAFCLRDLQMSFKLLYIPTKMIENPLVIRTLNFHFIYAQKGTSKHYTRCTLLRKYTAYFKKNTLDAGRKKNLNSFEFNPRYFADKTVKRKIFPLQITFKHTIFFQKKKMDGTRK